MLSFASSSRITSSGFRASISYKNRVAFSPFSSVPVDGRSQKSENRKWKYFHDVEIKKGSVAIVRIDCPGKVNVVSDEMRAEAEQLWIDQIEPNESIKSVVFISGKSDNFIAGADINMIKSTKNKAELKSICMNGHATFERFSRKKIPTIAAINGSCLGGGLEWALHCDYRIASTSNKTVLGLPEVKLGLLPGWGGTQLLRPLVGLQGALDMMLTGKNIRPDRALKMGLVDRLVDPASLESVSVDAAYDLSTGSLKVKKKSRGLLAKFLEDTPFGRNLVWKKVAETVEKNTGGKYPSPPNIVECVKYGYSASSLNDALEFEAQKFSEMANTSESEALIGIFNGTVLLKKNPYGKPEKTAEKLAILGAGLMGAGIAQISAEKGFHVLLKDRNIVSTGKGLNYIKNNMDEKLKKKKSTKFDCDVALSNVVPLSDDDDLWKRSLNHVDLVIEAVPENLQLKHKVIQQAEEFLPSHCIFATNTSALPIADIASASKRPQNIIGMHYFSPVPMMPLLEIIPHSGSSNEACARAVEVGSKQGKTAIIVKDVPGFFVNRCLGPFLVETCALIEAGVGLEQLDKIIKSFGLPVGPLTLIDEVGLDIAYHVQAFLSSADMGNRMGGANDKLLKDLVDKGMLGRKAGKGFFIYEGKKGKRLNPDALSIASSIVKEDLKLSPEVVQNRALSRFVNEAVLCLQDQIISSPVHGDIGAVFGMGFPPFLGGPFRMLDQVGIAKYCNMMENFADKYGPHFQPCQLMRDMAVSSKKFHI